MNKCGKIIIFTAVLHFAFRILHFAFTCDAYTKFFFCIIHLFYLKVKCFSCLKNKTRHFRARTSIYLCYEHAFCYRFYPVHGDTSYPLARYVFVNSACGRVQKRYLVSFPACYLRRMAGSHEGMGGLWNLPRCLERTQAPCPSAV